jgi:hypothetical protein
MKRRVFRAALVLAGLLGAAACEQAPGGGGGTQIALNSAADMAKIGLDAAYPLSGDYALGADLTLTDWTPIGTYAAPFTGTFDGNGRTLAIDGSGGVFAFADGAVIRNVTVEGTITASGAATIYVGGIVGNATNTSISACASHADIVAEGQGHNSSAGGIAGYLRENTAVADCYATGTIALKAYPEGEEDLGGNAGLMLYAGGIVGYLGTGTSGDGSSGCVVSRCYFAGSVSAEGGYPYAGGIAGYNYCGSIISECYAAGGAVSAEGANLPYAGGVAGYNSRNTESPSRVENCYSFVTVSAVSASRQALAGGVTAANAADAAVSACYARGAVSATVNGSSEAGIGGSIGVPASANAGGIAGAQYFGAPSIKNCVALNTELRGLDSGSGGSFNVHRIAGPGDGGDGGGAWESNLANVGSLAAGGAAVTPEPNDGSYDGGDCAATPAQAAYEDLGWDFVSVWKMDGDYPVLQWQQ